MNIIPYPIHLALTGKTVLHDENAIRFQTDKTIPAEGYEITADEEKILIKSSDDDGAYYAMLTLNQIVKNYPDKRIETLVIKDAPKYPYRGFMIDSCRHFFTVDEIKKMIDAAAMLKFNYFHFHLSDDQGFRMEISSWSRLTTVGAERSGSHFGRAEKDDTPYCHYYTKQQLRDIVAYCRQRHIQVVPEFDIPGHTSAVLSAYPQLSCRSAAVQSKTCSGIFKDILCAGNPDTVRMIKDVIDEMCEIFDGDYFHIGGDEAPKDRWNVCPKCRQKLAELQLDNMEQLHGHMVNEISAYLKTKGKKAICWNEALNGENLESDNMTIAFWMDKTDNSVKWANASKDIIIEKFNPYYSDYPYGMYPLSQVYRFNPERLKGLTQTGAKAIKGIETPIWTEYIRDFDSMTYMCFPRWFAVADTAWRGNDAKDYKRFVQSVRFYCDELNRLGMKTAPESDWTPNVFKRLSDSLKFAANLMTKDMIKSLLGKNE